LAIIALIGVIGSALIRRSGKESAPEKGEASSPQGMKGEASSPQGININNNISHVRDVNIVNTIGADNSKPILSCSNLHAQSEHRLTLSSQELKDLLYQSIFQGDANCVDVILAFGIDINGDDPVKGNPLRDAIFFSRWAVAKLLLDKGAKPDLSSERLGIGNDLEMATRNHAPEDVLNAIKAKGRTKN
jgi:hypothetical protein